MALHGAVELDRLPRVIMQNVSSARVTSVMETVAGGAGGGGGGAIPVREGWLKRSLWGLVALAVLAGFAYLLWTFSAPGPCKPGIDENAYVMSGRLLAQTGSIGFKPADPYQYVGLMWVKGNDGWYYPKYPAGVATLVAAAWKLAPAGKEATWIYMVSPFCILVGLWGSFRLGQMLAGGFYGVMTMIAVGCSQAVLSLSIWPSSHAPDLAVAVWAAVWMVRLATTGGIGAGILSGTLCGAAIWMRYSEGLLIIPLLVAAIFGIVARVKVSGWAWVSAPARLLLPLVCWGLVGGGLALLNWQTTGHLTGYDGTHESTGFLWETVLKKWDFTLEQLDLYGLFLIFPLGVAGLFGLMGRRPAVGLVLALAVAPQTLLYMAYYWGQQAPGVAYLRFFVAMYPVVCAAAVWMIAQGAAGGKAMARIGAALGAVTIVGATSAISVWATMPTLAKQSRGNLNLVYTGEHVRDVLAKDPHSATTRPSSRPTTTIATTLPTTLASTTEASSIFASSTRPIILIDMGLFPQHLMYLQCIIDADFYAADTFEPKAGGGFGFLGRPAGGGGGGGGRSRGGPGGQGGAGGGGGFGSRGGSNQSTDDMPVLIDPARTAEAVKLYENKSATELASLGREKMTAAIRAGRHVYLTFTPSESVRVRKQWAGKDSPFELEVLSKWKEQVSTDVESVSTPLAPRSMDMGPWMASAPKQWEMYRLKLRP